VGLEFLDPSSLRPYSLGHAYIRSLQLALADKCRTYESSERFFNLAIRILRTSMRELLSDTAGWDQPATADRIYGWVDVVRQAPQSRVQALAGQPDAVDVLHFLATGEERRGYESVDAAAAVRQIVPAFWEQYETELSQRPVSAKSSSTAISTSRIERVVTGWIDRTTALNVSSNGEAFVAGWIPAGLAPLHALALKVDDVVWWVELSDQDLAKVVEDIGSLPRLAPTAIRESTTAPATTNRLLIDSFVKYVPWNRDGGDSSKPVLMPAVSFRLWNPAMGDPMLHLEFAGAVPGIIGPHLRVTAEGNPLALQSPEVLRLRQDVRDALSSSELVEVLKDHAYADLAKALKTTHEKEELAASRVVANIERSILATLLQRAPSGRDLELLDLGMRVLPGAKKFGRFIAATYSSPARVDEALADQLRMLNSLARAVLGKPVFETDTRGRVRYRGLWGDA
jgi:hypothetical protein